MKYLIIILFSLFLFACKTQQSITEVPIHYKEKIIERLVPVELPTDSAIIAALFACDSTNQVYLKELSESKSQHMQSAVSFQDGKLNYKAKTNPDTVFIHVTDTIRLQEKAVKVEVPVKVNYVNQWQIFQIWMGRILLLIVSVKLLLKYAKWPILRKP